MLGTAIREGALERQLSALQGKTYSIISHVENQGSAPFYLFFRNQVCNSSWKPLVGLVIIQDKLTRFYNRKAITTKIRRQLGKGERLSDFQPGLMSKRGVNDILAERILLMRCAGDISRDLLHIFLKEILEKIAPSVDGVDVLSMKFRVGSFKDGADLYDGGPYAANYRFDKDLGGSLLQRIVVLKHKYNTDLFVAVLPTYPQVEQGFSYNQKQRYYSQLENYLEDNGIKYVSFWDNEELNNPDLFLDTAHMKSFMRFHELLAQELVAKGIVK